MPVGAFLIVTEPLPIATLDRLLPRRRMAVDTKNLVNYFRTTPDNRLLFGGRARFAISNPASDEKSGAILQAAAARRLSVSFAPCASTIAGAGWST